MQLVRALFFAIAVACLVTGCPASTSTPASPEVFILDGLVFDYGEAEPCYGAETGSSTDHAARCLGNGDNFLTQYPMVTVRLDPFAIDQHEVTNAQYASCVAAGHCLVPWYTDSFTQGNNYYFDAQYADYPVQQVTQLMARNYCEYRAVASPPTPSGSGSPRGAGARHASGLSRGRNHHDGRLHGAGRQHDGSGL